MEKDIKDVVTAALGWYGLRNGTRADQIAAERKLTTAIEALHRQGRPQPHPPA